MHIGYIGLGKMGQNMVRRMLKKGYRVVAYDVDPDAKSSVRAFGAKTASSLKELVWSLPAPRLIWLMVPHKAVDKTLPEVLKYIKRGDTIIDGGNSFYADTVRRAKTAAKKGAAFLDIGVSGGPGGALNGACLMVGGKEQDYKKFTELFRDLSVEDGYGYMGPSGAGHFTKMVHNGIEYGMMQALGEGFAILKKSPFKLNLKNAAHIYNHGSVIESRLTNWLEDAFKKYGEDLVDISGTVSHTGEGEWTVQAGKKLNVPTPVIKDSFVFRIRSKKNPSYIGKILSALRNQFGGHSVADK